jgi:signal peptidase II
MELILRPELSGQGLGFVDWFMNPPLRMDFVSVPVMPYFNLTMVWNHGVSFGLFNDLGIWPLVIIASVVSSIFGYWMMKTQSVFESVALSFVIGGAIGNIIDRFRFGAVADFFDVYVDAYHWPCFNIADSAIVIGVAMLVIHGLFFNKKDSTQ